MLTTTVSKPPKDELNYQQQRQQKIEWLIANGLAAIAVAPYQDPYKYHKTVKASKNRGTYCPLTVDLKPIPLFTGKNPSFLDEHGNPHLIIHQTYQTRLPSKKERDKWFANPSNGIGTLGSDRIKWIDLDSKQFSSQEECDRAFNSLLEANPKLKQTLLEKTQSGGYRIGVKVNKPIDFTNFALEKGGHHVGECLGAGRFTVLAPTVGGKGSYVNLNLPDELIEIEEIDFLYPTKTDKESNSSTESKPLPKPQPSSTGVIALDQLGHSESQKILNGEDTRADRSESLTVGIAEWAGWSNWCHYNNVSFTGTVEALATEAGEKLGIDTDRVTRIINTINLDQCQPAAMYRGSDESCWRKVKRLDYQTYQKQCPDSLKSSIDNGSLPPFKGNNGAGGGGNGGNNSDDAYLPPRNNWNAPVPWNGELGYWVTLKKTKNNAADGETDPMKIFIPKCNFDLEVERELSDAEGGGLVLQVKRSIDTRQKRVIIPSLDKITVKEFTTAMIKAYGTLIICNLSTAELGALLQSKMIAYRDRGGETFILADRIGQTDSGTWVFSDRQFTGDGNPTTEAVSKVVYNSNLGKEDKIPTPTISDPNSNALTNLVKAMHKFHGESQIEAAIFVLGWAVACLHFQEILRAEKHFPLINAYGDPGSGKTVMAESALSLSGWQGGQGMFRKITESALYEHLKLCGSLPLCLDDPDKGLWLDTLIQGLYNAKPRSVRGNEQTPHTSLIITSNHLVGDLKPATLSRLIPIAVFPSTDGDRNAWDELVAAQRSASGALPQLIGLGYPAHEVRTLAAELRQHLQRSHVRVSDSIALVLWYAMAVCRLSGFDEQRIKKYAIATLARQCNDADSATDSLADFLDKSMSLHGQSVIGEWDTRLVTTRDGFTGLAINMPSVWGKIERIYNPPYSRRLIEAQIAKAGGILKSVQKFYRSEDEVKAYRRALVTGHIDSDNYVSPRPPEEVSKKCVIIPLNLISDFMGAWKDKDEPIPPDDDPKPPNNNGGGGGSPGPEDPDTGDDSPGPEDPDTGDDSPRAVNPNPGNEGNTVEPEDQVTSDIPVVTDPLPEKGNLSNAASDNDSDITPNTSYPLKKEDVSSVESENLVSESNYSVNPIAQENRATNNNPSLVAVTGEKATDNLITKTDTGVTDPWESLSLPLGTALNNAPASKPNNENAAPSELFTPLYQIGDVMRYVGNNVNYTSQYGERDLTVFKIDNQGFRGIYYALSGSKGLVTTWLAEGDLKRVKG